MRQNIKIYTRLILERSPSNIEYSVPDQPKNSTNIQPSSSNRVDDASQINNQCSTSTAPPKPAPCAPQMLE